MTECTVTERAMSNIRKSNAQAFLTSAKPPEKVELVIAPGRRITYVLEVHNDEFMYRLFRTPTGIDAPERVPYTRMQRAMQAMADGVPLANAFS